LQIGHVLRERKCIELGKYDDDGLRTMQGGF
jgi:hypothetical protein